MEEANVIVIAGPTGAGKTRLSIELAKQFGGEVISADSMQLYKQMDIGTAKPDMEEKQGVPHHLMDLLEPWESFSVADFVLRAGELIRDINGRGKLPFVVGGTGLYISSLLDNVQFTSEKTDQALRQALQEQGREHGNDYLYDRLMSIDPEYARTLHPNNTGRVIRAIELNETTGIPMSEHMRRSKLQKSPYRYLYLGINYRNRQTLYDRIEKRVDAMMAAGLLEEAKKLQTIPLSSTAAQAIGYKELSGYLVGESSLEQAIDKLKQYSRNYAKRQLTWFRKDQRVQWLYVDDYADISELIQQARQMVADFITDQR